MSLMQRIPLHAKEVKTFKPDSLTDMPDVPVFTLKAPTRQQREDMIYAMREDGFRTHTKEAMREAAVEELCRLWECDANDQQVEQLREFWNASDNYDDDVQELFEAAKNDGVETPGEIPPFDHPALADVAELFERLERRSKRWRAMAIDNAKYGNAFSRYAIAHCVTGWTGLATVPRFEDELLTIDAVCELADELENRFDIAGETAMADLAKAAVNRLFLTEATEKNSESGPVSQQTPDTTKEVGSGSANGKSPASVSSPETPGS